MQRYQRPGVPQLHRRRCLARHASLRGVSHPLLPRSVPLAQRSRHRATPAAAASQADDFGSRLRHGAASRFKQAAEQLEDTSRRMAGRLNRTLHLQEQGKRAQSAVVDGTAWLEQRVQLKRRLQLLAETVRQESPKWQRQLRDFNDSKVGQLFWLALFVYTLYTGVFFTILFSALRIVFLVSWLIPLLLMLSLRQFNGQMAAAQAQQRAAAAQQATRRNPFGGSPFSQQFRQQGRGRTAPSKPGPDFMQQPGGPIIDAEFETIDDGDQ